MHSNIYALKGSGALVPLLFSIAISAPAWKNLKKICSGFFILSVPLVMMAADLPYDNNTKKRTNRMSVRKTPTRNYEKCSANCVYILWEKLCQITYGNVDGRVFLLEKWIECSAWNDAAVSDGAIDEISF